MLHVAGEVCDGVRLHGICTRRYLDEIAFPNLRKGFAKSGRPAAEWESFQISGGGFLCVAPDADSLARAVEKMKETVAFYGSTRSYRASFERMGRQGRAASSAVGATEVARDAKAGYRRDGARVRRGRYL
jgi:hypothetical protein